MAAEAMDVQQLLQLAREKSEQARSHLFEVMGDLFQAQAAVLSAQERALMVDILEKLVREVSHDIRMKLSHRLADLPGIPRELAVLLANDEIDIASPILMRSRALQDTDLIEIVHHRSRQHKDGQHEGNLTPQIVHDLLPRREKRLVGVGNGVRTRDFRSHSPALYR